AYSVTYKHKHTYTHSWLSTTQTIQCMLTVVHFSIQFELVGDCWLVCTIGDYEEDAGGLSWIFGYYRSLRFSEHKALFSTIGLNSLFQKRRYCKIIHKI